MIEPTIAVSQLEMSKNSSIGSAPNKTPARNPPRSAPTTPMTAVTMNPFAVRKRAGGLPGGCGDPVASRHPTP